MKIGKGYARGQLIAYLDSWISLTREKWTFYCTRVSIYCPPSIVLSMPLSPIK
jgi:hypothetical protein